MSNLVITIDGPAASGKTSVSRGIANRLGWPWVSTGAFYRGIAYLALQRKIDLADEKSLIQLVKSNSWSVVLGDKRTLLMDGKQDVTDEIYKEKIGLAASDISHHPELRKSLLQAQRDCVLGNPGLVAEGRDCGTVVFPTARVKFFLTANSDNRAERRAKQTGADVDKTKKAQVARDTQDSTRQAAPMQIPEGAYVVDTTEMGLDEVVDYIYRVVEQELHLSNPEATPPPAAP